VVLNLIKGYLCISWDDKVFFVFASINVLYYIFWFVYIELSLHPWDEAHLVLVTDPSDILLRIFTSLFIKEIGL
jgi:hypothetical protein